MKIIYNTKRKGELYGIIIGQLFAGAEIEK